MKPTFLQAVSILITLFFIHYLSPSIATFLPTAFIWDENGEPMINGGTYSMHIKGGGFITTTTAPTTTSSPCPLYLTVDKNPTLKPTLFNISSHINSKYLPYGSTDFTIVGVDTACTEPLVWQVKPDDAYVVAGTPNPKVPSAFSLIQPFNYDPDDLWSFEIIFCNEKVCGRANVIEDNGLIGINFDMSNLDVRFRKAFTGSSQV